MQADILSQLKMMESYYQLEQDLNKTLQSTDPEKSKDNDPNHSNLVDISNEMKLLESDMQVRINDSGGWEKLLFAENGKVNRELPLDQWSTGEKIDILKAMNKAIIIEEAKVREELTSYFQNHLESLSEEPPQVVVKEDTACPELKVSINSHLSSLLSEYLSDL